MLPRSTRIIPRLASVGLALVLLHGKPATSILAMDREDTVAGGGQEAKEAERFNIYVQNDIILPGRSLADESGLSSDPLREFTQSILDFFAYIYHQIMIQFFGCPIPEVPAPLPGKKGIGLTLRDEGQPGSWVEHLPKVTALAVSWNYSWNRVRIPQQPDDIEFVPMIWGANEENIQTRVTDVVSDYRAGLTHRLLAFNEPDNPNQASMSVETAVGLWHYLEDTGMPLASPSAVHVNREWMVEFMDLVDTSCLRMNYIGVHWYGNPNAQSFKEHMESAYAQYGSKWPLILTEFAPADWTTGGDPSRNRFTEKMVLDFAKEVIPWLEQQDWIAAYAWFPFKDTSPQGHTSALFDSDGRLTLLGEFYASVTPNNPFGDQTIALEE